MSFIDALIGVLLLGLACIGVYCILTILPSSNNWAVCCDGALGPCHWCQNAPVAIESGDYIGIERTAVSVYPPDKSGMCIEPTVYLVKLSIDLEEGKEERLVALEEGSDTGSECPMITGPYEPFFRPPSGYTAWRYGNEIVSANEW
jgi:hypothetical protein